MFFNAPVTRPQTANPDFPPMPLLDRIRTGEALSRSERLRLIADMSVPSMLAQVSATIMFFIDAAMVGRLGGRESAAVGLVESATWLFGGLSGAVSMGFSVQIAHFIGAGDFAAARSVLRQGLVCALAFSLLFCAIAAAVSGPLPVWLGGGPDITADASAYFLIFACAIPFLQIESLSAASLKCSGNMKVPSALNIAMCCLDVGFNYLFIYVLGLGVVGAALGTLVAVVLTASALLWFVVCRGGPLSLRGHGGSFRPSRGVVGAAFKIGAPMGLQQLLMSGAQIVQTMIVAPLGNVALAANTFAITVESLCYMPGYGIADAATTLVGQAYGAARRKLMVSFARLSVGAGMAVMGALAVLMWAFAPQMMALLTPLPDIQAAGATALRIEAFAEPMFAASIVCYGVFVGMGDTLKPALINLSTMWGVRLTLAAALAPRYGLAGVWAGMALELTARGAVFLWRLARVK